MRTLLDLPLRYRATIVVALVMVVSTYIARALIDDQSLAAMEEWGYGLPALQAGRWWTLLTGVVLLQSLAVPIPIFTYLAVGLYEHSAGHWRPLVAVFGGQVLATVLVLLAIIPLEGASSAFAVEVTTATDFGISAGAFACLGAWTAYLRGPWRRTLRWGVSAYHVGPILFSGFIYDLTHPAGWFLGLWAGHLLMRPAVEDATAFSTRELPWILGAAAAALAAGIWVGWNPDAVGGIFGWGPGA